MSFVFQFFASTRRNAVVELAKVDAPPAVKALVDHAVSCMPWSRQPSSYAYTEAVLQDARGGIASSRVPVLAGVSVHVEGHFDYDGGGESTLSRFVVRPLYE